MAPTKQDRSFIGREWDEDEGRIIEDAWVCACGNTPNGDGFYSVDPGGNWIEPLVDSAWDGKRYGCASCGRIVDQDTLEIVGQMTE